MSEPRQTRKFHAAQRENEKTRRALGLPGDSVALESQGTCLTSAPLVPGSHPSEQPRLHPPDCQSGTCRARLLHRPRGRDLLLHRLPWPDDLRRPKKQENKARFYTCSALKEPGTNLQHLRIDTLKQTRVAAFAVTPAGLMRLSP